MSTPRRTGPGTSGRSLSALATALALVVAFAGAARAQEGAPSVLVFAGEAVRGGIWQQDALPFIADSAHQVQIGAALAALPLELRWGWRLGIEAGLSWRRDGDGLGRAGTSWEVWAGPTIRHEGFALGALRIKPGLTMGYTAVTASHGLERAHEIEEDGQARFLYFLAPEISVALAAHPGIDLVYRVQHRSGGKNVHLPALGNLGDVTNANVLGLRWRF